MAQIFRYQRGGSATNKYGTFTYDNNTIQVDDDFINQLTAYGKTLDGKVGNQFNNIIQAVKNGEDIKFESTGDGRIYGNVSFDITDKQAKRMEKARTSSGRFFGSAWNGKEQSSRLAINALKGFNYIKPQQAGTHYDWSKGINVEYKRDKDGKYELVDGKRVFIQGANNLRVRRRLEALKEIANYADSDEFTGYGKLDKQAYIDLYNKLGDEGVANLIQRVEEGTWTEEDKMALDDIGILLDNETESNQSSSSTQNEEDEKISTLRTAGLPTDNQHLLNLGLVRNQDGTYRLNDPNLGNQIFGSNRRYINDNFLDTNHQYDALKGWFWWDGNLIPRSIAEDDNSTFYRNLGNWIYNNKTNNFGTNGVAIWGNDTDPFTTYDSSFFIPGLKNNNQNIRFRTITNPSDTDNIIYEYYDDLSARDRYGFITPEGIKRIQYNTKTGETTELDSLNGLDINYNAIDNNIKQYSDRAPGYYEININDGDNNVTIFRNPYDKYDVWYYKEGMSQPYKLAPTEVDSLVSEGLLQSNPELFVGSGSISRQQDEAFSSNRPNYRGQTVWGKTIDYLSLFGGLSSLARRMYTTKTPEVNGEPWNRTPSNIFKHQSGGRINYGVKSQKDNNSEVKATKVNDSSDAKKTESLEASFTDLTKADKMQIASIATDVAALIAAIPTGGNPVAGALGYGSSIAQFGADVSRDGFQGKDLLSLLGNLGLDTISLLPGAGIAGKLAKTGKVVKKSASLLKNVLLAAGAVNAAKAATNIASGKGTLDDWKSLSTGLFAIKGIKNEVQNIKATNYKGKAPKITGKTKEDLRNEYVDKIVADKKLGFVDGENPTRWANQDGTVKNYEQAIEDLTKAGHLKISKTQEAKWAAKAAKEGVEAGMSNMLSNSLNPFSSNYRFRMSNRTLQEGFDLRELSGQTSKLRTLQRVAASNPEIAKQLQDQGWILPEVLNFRSNYGGNWFYRSPVFRRFIQFRTPNIPLLPPSSGVRDIPITLSGRKNPTEVIDLDPYTQRINDYIGLRFHKKGGKVVKAGNGVLIEPVTVTARDPQKPKIDFGGVKAPVLTNGMWAEMKGIKQNFVIPKGFTPFKSEDQFEVTANQIREHSASINEAKKQEVLNKLPVSVGGTKQEPFWKRINPDTILGLGDFIVSQRAINKSNQKQKDAIRKGMIGSQQSMPTEHYSRFSDNGLHRAYDDRMTSMRQYQTNTSDPRQVMAERLTRDMYIDQMKNERDTKFSQMIDQYNDKVLAQKQQYANLRTQIANENRNKWYTGLAQLDMADANKELQTAQNIKNLIYEGRQNLASDLNARQQAKLSTNRLKAQSDFENELATKYQAAFNDPSVDKSKYAGLAEYVYKTNLKDYNDIHNKYMANFEIKSFNEGVPYGPYRQPLPLYQSPYRYVQPTPEWVTEMYKKGGTISRYRDVGEQAFLDQQKAINKAVNNLNNNIIKLFLKMMS